MAKRDYSNTGQRSQSDELFEDIFQLALTKEQRKKKGAKPVAQTGKKSPPAPDASPAQTRKVTPAPPLRRSAARPQEQQTDERKAASKKRRSGRLTKILIGLLFLAGAGAVASFLMPGYELADFLPKKQEPSTVKKEMPRRPSPAPVSGQPGITFSRVFPAEPESPQSSIPPSVEMTKNKGEVGKREIKVEPGSPSPAEARPTVNKAEQPIGDSKKGTAKVSPSQGKAKSYPYSVYLGSYKREDAVQKALALYKENGLAPYQVRMDMGSKGIWMRVFSGHFESQGEAEAFIKQRQISEAEVKHTRYAVLLGEYPSRQEAEARVSALKHAGCHAYAIGVSQAGLRVYTGAYYRMEDAEQELAWLSSKNVKGTIVER